MSVPSPSILALADDLTGALEAGAKFAPARVTTRLDASSDGLLVVDTETRHLPAAEAAARVRTAATHAPTLIYKKTDSTLRGNIGAELAALHELYPDRPMIYVPAYPEMGRTVRNGELLVYGVPVHQTAFANDPLNPIRDSRIQTLLGPLEATILDGETDEDVRAAARQVFEYESAIVAGPAAIAGAIAEQLPPRPKPELPRATRCLVINGSLHPTAAAQMDCAHQAGWTVFSYEGPEAGLERARRIGSCVQAILQQATYDALIIMGGDTAFGIHEALGAEDFTVYGDILPGVPLSRANGITWITKAGGFGPPDLLPRLKEQL
jgi:uncharacterized protein YgbK (DUF1537 family)